MTHWQSPPGGVKLYHYTSEDGYKGIQRSQVINASKVNATNGVGVYLTPIPPWKSDKEIIYNNWDGGPSNLKLQLSKIEYYVEIDSRNLTGLIKHPRGRKELVHPGAIHLGRIPYQIRARAYGLKLYHYTSEDGYKGMMRSKTINSSNRGPKGDVVYLTTIPPRKCDQELVYKNWDSEASNSSRELSKRDYYFEFDSKNLENLERNERKRTEFLHTGPINLKEVPHKISYRGHGMQLYHYTSEDGYEAILRTQMIQISNNGAMGDGVYLTTIPPWKSDQEIMNNNWGTSNLSKIEYYFEIDSRHLPGMKKNQGGRNIFLHSDPIYLSEIPHKFGFRGHNN